MFKKNLIIIYLLSVIISLLSRANCQNQRDLTPCLYTDPQYGYRISCPESGWSMTDKTGITDVLLIIKSESNTGDFIPNVTITIECISRNMNAEQYAEKNMNLLADAGYEIILYNKKIINKNVFYELHCLDQRTSPHMRFNYLCLVRNRIGFVITCVVTENLYDKFAKDFEFILNSFRFL